MARAPKPASTITDGLANVITGAGTALDKRSGRFHALSIVNPVEIYASYRDNWIMRKIVDLPPHDMTRAGRDWQADGDVIEKIEAAEKQFGLWAKLQLALKYGRLGGGAIIIGVGSNPQDPLPPKIAKGQLAYLHVVSRWQMSLGQIIFDPANPLFGQPEYFTLNGTQEVKIHPSRIVVFKGNFVPHDFNGNTLEMFWGDSIFRSVKDAVGDASSALSSFATLIEEAKVDVYRFKGLADMLATPNGDAKVQQRVQLATLSKSIHQAIILADGDEWDQKQVAWAGMPDVVATYLSTIAAAADIPATRFLGKSPDGMNATGDGDERNYITRIQSDQESILRPALDVLDPLIAASAGIAITDAVYTFAPLKIMDETEQANIMFLKAQAVTQYVTNATVPHDALAKAVPNMLIEDGVLPGLDAAMDEIEVQTGSLESNPDDPPELDLNNEPIDPSAITQPSA